MYIILALIILFVMLFRMGARMFLFKKQMNIPYWKGLIPIFSELIMYKKIKKEKSCFAGIILRSMGGLLFLVVFVWQSYIIQVTLTHIYGVILGYYTVPDYSKVWSYLMTIAAMCVILGVVIRLIISKRLFRFFGLNNSVLNFIAMFMPGIATLYVALSKKHKFLLNKKISEMSRDEFLLYTTISEEE